MVASIFSGPNEAKPESLFEKTLIFVNFPQRGAAGKDGNGLAWGCGGLFGGLMGGGRTIALKILSFFVFGVSYLARVEEWRKP
jgi:hypothetical protein